VKRKGGKSSHSLKLLADTFKPERKEKGGDIICSDSRLLLGSMKKEKKRKEKKDNEFE